MAGDSQPRLAVIGGGPAGLMAAEAARAAGIDVDLYEGLGSVGRKFLLAGKGGLNLTHAEPPAAFVQRYAERAEAVAAWLRDFDAAALRDWARGLGVDTFVGTSGRVFPADLKAATREFKAALRARIEASGRTVEEVFAAVAPLPEWQLEFYIDDPGPAVIAASDGAAAVVIGTREHRGLGRLVYGSVSRYCLGHAKAPVIVVPFGED